MPRTRAWVWAVGVGGIIACAGCSQHRTAATSAPAAQDDPLPASLVEAARQYGVKIDVMTRPTPWLSSIFQTYRTGPSAPEQVRSFAPLLASEMKRYPPVLFRRIRIERIVLCGSIRDGKTEIGGFASAWQNAIYLNIRGGWDEAYHRTSFHHELFHVLDARNGHARDAQWRALNPKGFRYGGSKQELWNTAGRGGEGFLIADGKRNIDEDKAHYFTFMMAYYAAVRDLGRRDAIVRAKADLMERIVADFCPEIDAAFWAEAQRRSETVENRIVAAVRQGWVRSSRESVR